MAERKRNIAITTWAEYMDVWCDKSLKTFIEDIGGVVRVDAVPGTRQSHFHVFYDACYNLDDIVTEMRALAGE